VIVGQPLVSELVSRPTPGLTSKAHDTNRGTALILLKAISTRKSCKSLVDKVEGQGFAAEPFAAQLRMHPEVREDAGFRDLFGRFRVSP
jgi:hypothetical protein